MIKCGSHLHVHRFTKLRRPKDRRSGRRGRWRDEEKQRFADYNGAMKQRDGDRQTGGRMFCAGDLCRFLVFIYCYIHLNDTNTAFYFFCIVEIYRRSAA